MHAFPSWDVKKLFIFCTSFLQLVEVKTRLGEMANIMLQA